MMMCVYILLVASDLPYLLALFNSWFMGHCTVHTCVLQNSLSHLCKMYRVVCRVDETSNWSVEFGKRHQPLAWSVFVQTEWMSCRKYWRKSHFQRWLAKLSASPAHIWTPPNSPPFLAAVFCVPFLYFSLQSSFEQLTPITRRMPDQKLELFCRPANWTGG